MMLEQMNETIYHLEDMMIKITHNIFHYNVRDYKWYRENTIDHAFAHNPGYLDINLTGLINWGPDKGNVDLNKDDIKHTGATRKQRIAIFK